MKRLFSVSVYGFCLWSTLHFEFMTDKFHIGFTLIEIMVAIAIGAVLLTLAVPGFSEMIRNNRMNSAIYSFNSSLNLARSTSIKQGVDVTVCKSADGASCSNAGDFSQGWLTFIDDGASVRVVDVGEQLLQVSPALHATISLIGSGSGPSNAASSITYSANGTTQDSGTITLCGDVSGQYGKVLHISTIGRNNISSEETC